MFTEILVDHSEGYNKSKALFLYLLLCVVGGPTLLQIPKYVVVVCLCVCACVHVQGVGGRPARSGEQCGVHVSVAASQPHLQLPGQPQAAGGSHVCVPHQNTRKCICDEVHVYVYVIGGGGG